MRVLGYAFCVMSVAALLGGGVMVSAPAFAAAAKKSTMSPEEKKARSKECSDAADKKGLHGKERHKFRSKCKREGVT